MPFKASGAGAVSASILESPVKFGTKIALTGSHVFLTSWRTTLICRRVKTSRELYAVIIENRIG
jgi:hypothetical protein